MLEYNLVPIYHEINSKSLTLTFAIYGQERYNMAFHCTYSKNWLLVLCCRGGSGGDDAMVKIT